MSYPYPTPDFTVPAAPIGYPSKRPGTVTAAAWLLVGTALCFLALMVVVAYDLASYPAWADAAAARLHTDPATLASAKSDNTDGDIATLIGIGLLAVGLVASAAMVMRRMRTGQIMAYVFAVLTVLCCGISIVGGFVAAGDSTNAFDQATTDATPGWNAAVSLAAGLAFPLVIAAFVLLLLPSARRYFSRTPAAPSGFMYLPGPGMPGAPTYPGYPPVYPAPQQWMAPTYPTYPGPESTAPTSPSPTSPPPTWPNPTSPPDASTPDSPPPAGPTDAG